MTPNQPYGPGFNSPPPFANIFFENYDPSPTVASTTAAAVSALQTSSALFSSMAPFTGDSFGNPFSQTVAPAPQTSDSDSLPRALPVLPIWIGDECFLWPSSSTAPADSTFPPFAAPSLEQTDGAGNSLANSSAFSETDGLSYTQFPPIRSLSQLQFPLASPSGPVPPSMDLSNTDLSSIPVQPLTDSDHDAFVETCLEQANSIQRGLQNGESPPQMLLEFIEINNELLAIYAMPDQGKNCKTTQDRLKVLREKLKDALKFLDERRQELSQTRSDLVEPMHTEEEAPPPPCLNLRKRRQDIPRPVGLEKGPFTKRQRITPDLSIMELYEENIPVRLLEKSMRIYGSNPEEGCVTLRSELDTTGEKLEKIDIGTQGLYYNPQVGAKILLNYRFHTDPSTGKIPLQKVYFKAEVLRISQSRSQESARVDLQFENGEKLPRRSIQCLKRMLPFNPDLIEKLITEGKLDRREINHPFIKGTVLTAYTFSYGRSFTGLDTH